MATLPDLKLSVECVDDADVCSGVVVFDDLAFPLFSRPAPSQETADNYGQGLYRTVTVSQLPSYGGDRDTTMPQGSPATVGDSNPSAEEEEVEEDE